MCRRCSLTCASGACCMVYTEEGMMEPCSGHKSRSAMKRLLGVNALCQLARQDQLQGGNLAHLAVTMLNEDAVTDNLAYACSLHDEANVEQRKNYVQRAMYTFFVYMCISTSIKK